MKIDYVILSSDDSYYLDFYKPVSTLWNHFGLKTLMFHITDIETDFEKNKFGLYKKIKAIPDIPTSWQAQLIRLYAYKYFDNNCLMTSDIDMMPLNGKYFTNQAEGLLPGEILNYSGQPYGNVPYFPMCYILGESNVMSNVLELENTYEKFLLKIMMKYSTKWNADENYLYDCLIGYPNLKNLKDRKFLKDRIDRSRWFYEIDLIKSQSYIDCHMLRPYKEYKQEIDKLAIITLENTKGTI